MQYRTRPNYLFNGADMHSVVQHQEKQLIGEIDAPGGDYILNMSMSWRLKNSLGRILVLADTRIVIKIFSDTSQEFISDLNHSSVTASFGVLAPCVEDPEDFSIASASALSFMYTIIGCGANDT